MGEGVMLTVRIAKPEETVEIATLMKGYEQATRFLKVDVHHAARVYADMIRNGSATLFVMEEDGKQIGGIGCLKSKALNDGALTAHEGYWFVHPDHRGKGKVLLDFFEKWAVESGCKRIMLMHLTDSYPDSLCSLYERMGYSEMQKVYVKEI